MDILIRYARKKFLIWGGGGGGSGGAMVLGKLPVPGRPRFLLVWVKVGQGPTALAVSAGGGWWVVFGHFFSRLPFLFSFCLSLGDGPI